MSSAATGTMNLGSHERPPYDVSNSRRTRQTGSWRQPPQENSSRGADAAILTKIGSQSFADLRQKWQPIHNPALAVNHDRQYRPNPWQCEISAKTPSVTSSERLLIAEASGIIVIG